MSREKGKFGLEKFLNIVKTATRYRIICVPIFISEMMKELFFVQLYFNFNVRKYNTCQNHLYLYPSTGLLFPLFM